MKKVLEKVKKVMLILAVFSSLISCNLCPNSPSNENPGNIAYFTFQTKANSSVIFKYNFNDFNLSEISENSQNFSRPAQNGDISVTKMNEKLTELYLGNVNSKNFIKIESENSLYTINKPVISPKSNKVAFGGGTNQLYLWVNDPISNSIYIEKVSSAFYDNSIPTFANDGKYLVFIEKVDETGIRIKAVATESIDNIIYTKEFFGHFPITNGINQLSISDNNKVLFVSTDGTDSYLNIMDLANSNTEQIKLNSSLGATNAKIAPDGNYALLISLDGNLWGLPLQNSERKFFQISNNENCESYIDFDWNKGSNKIIGFRKSCNDANSGMAGYLLNLKLSVDNIELESEIYLCNDILTGFWGY
jgi:hypothetical protein